MRKILPSLIISSLAFFLFPSIAFAQNKLGVNIGDHYSEASIARSLVGRGGWIVAMGTPGNCPDFETLFGRGANIVIRGDVPGLDLSTLTADEGDMSGLDGLALSWAATLGNMDSKGQKIYFMPVNEPVHYGLSRENVKFYTDKLKHYLSEAGLLGSKVNLLSPMFDQHNPGYDHYVTNGLGFDYYKGFHGSSVNLYHIFGSGNPRMQYSGYDQFGIPGPYYAIEAGVAGTCVPPCYADGDIARMLREALSTKWQGDGNFKMFAVFSYDPHRAGWSIYSASQTKAVYNDFRHETDPNSGSYDQTHFEGWRDELLAGGVLIPCGEGNCGLVTDPRFCEAVRAGESIHPCDDPVGGHLFGQCAYRGEFKKEESWTEPYPIPWTERDKAFDFGGIFSVSEVTIPIEGHLDYLFGYYEGPEFRYGVIWDLTPPAYTEVLEERVPLYLESYTDAKIQIYTPFDELPPEEKERILRGEREGVLAEDFIYIAFPEVYGLYRVAEGNDQDPSLYNFLEKKPGQWKESVPYVQKQENLFAQGNSSSTLYSPSSAQLASASLQAASPPADNLLSGEVLGVSMNPGCAEIRDGPQLPTDCFRTTYTEIVGYKMEEVDADDDCTCYFLPPPPYCRCKKEATQKFDLNLLTTYVPLYARGIIATLPNLIPPSDLEEVKEEAGRGWITWAYPGQGSRSEIFYRDLGTVQNLMETVQQYRPPSWGGVEVPIGFPPGTPTEPPTGPSAPTPAQDPIELATTIQAWADGMWGVGAGDRCIYLALTGGESSFGKNCGRCIAWQEYAKNRALNTAAQRNALTRMARIWKNHDIRASDKSLSRSYVPSSYDPTGIIGSCGGGALGISQFIPTTAIIHLGTIGEPFDLWDAETAMKVMAAELHRLGWRRGLSFPQQVSVLLRWNWHRSWVSRIIAVARQYYLYLKARGL